MKYDESVALEESKIGILNAEIRLDVIRQDQKNVPIYKIKHINPHEYA